MSSECYHISPDDAPAARLRQIALMSTDHLINITALRSQWRAAVDGIEAESRNTLASALHRFAPDLAAELRSRWQAANDCTALEALMREPT